MAMHVATIDGVNRTQRIDGLDRTQRIGPLLHTEGPFQGRVEALYVRHCKGEYIYIYKAAEALPSTLENLFIIHPSGGPQSTLLCESVCTAQPGPRSNFEPIYASSKQTIFDDFVCAEDNENGCLHY